MTTAEIVKFVESFGSDNNAASEALLGKLQAKEVTMEELEKAIGVDSEAYPFGYPETDAYVEPSFLARLAVKKMRAEGDESAFAC